MVIPKLDGRIRTYTGRLVDPFNLKVEDIDIRDIAQGLANNCRFGGQIRVFLSVAQHSIYVAGRLPVKKKMWGLLHDATEAYLLDIPKPIKDKIPEYRAAELRAAEVIANRFGLPVGFQNDPEVKIADAAGLDHDYANFVIGNRMATSPQVSRDAFLHYWSSLIRVH